MEENKNISEPTAEPVVPAVEPVATPEHELLKVSDLARFLSVTNQCIYRLTKKHKIPFYKVGGSVRFSKAEFDEYLKGCHSSKAVEVFVERRKKKKSKKKGK